MKTSIDSLLRLLADYRSFCKQPQDGIVRPVTGNCELSEDELELVAAAAHIPQPINNKNENP